MDSLIILSLFFIMVAISFSLLSSKTVQNVIKRYLKLNQSLEDYFFSIKKEKKERITNIHESNTSNIIIEDDVFLGKKDIVLKSFYPDRHSADFLNKSSESREKYLDIMEDKMKYYMKAEKYKITGTLNQLRKLEEEWA